MAVAPGVAPVAAGVGVGVQTASALQIKLWHSLDDTHALVSSMGQASFPTPPENGDGNTVYTQTMGAYKLASESSANFQPWTSFGVRACLHFSPTAPVQAWLVLRDCSSKHV